MTHVGLKPDSKAVVSPAVKTKAGILDGADCDPDQTKLFKSVCMRLQFLCLDRPGVAVSRKGVRRAMARPTLTAWEALERCARYLSGHRRLIWIWKQQCLQKYLKANTDANYAGCLSTRKSTTCVVV